MLLRNSTLPPTPTQVDRERQEPTLEAPNADPSALTRRAPDAGMGSVEQGQGGVAEHAQPTPTKDTTVSSRAIVPEPMPRATYCSTFRPLPAVVGIGRNETYATLATCITTL